MVDIGIVGPVLGVALDDSQHGFYVICSSLKACIFIIKKRRIIKNRNKKGNAPYLVLSDVGGGADDDPAVPLGIGVLLSAALDEGAVGSVLGGSVGELLSNQHMLTVYHLPPPQLFLDGARF